jgi:hypothetical protein
VIFLPPDALPEPPRPANSSAAARQALPRATKQPPRDVSEDARERIPIIFYLSPAAWTRLAVGFVLVCLVAYHFPYHLVFRPAQADTSAAAEKLTVEELYKKAVRDRRMASFLGSFWTVSVTGEIDEIDAAEQVVYLKRAKTAKDKGKIACKLASSEDTTGLRAGGPVTLQGICEGRDTDTLTVHLTKCQVVP